MRMAQLFPDAFQLALDKHRFSSEAGPLLRPRDDLYVDANEGRIQCD